MSRFRLILPPLVLAVLTACGASDTAAPAQTAAADTATTAAPVAAPAQPEPAAPATARGFDIQQVPVSQASLGAFPYFSLPEGYLSRNTEQRRFDRVPFWTGDRLEWVEGQTWGTQVHTQRTDDFSHAELLANVRAVVEAAGGQLVSEGMLPPEARQAITEAPDKVAMRYGSALGDIYNEPATVWVIRLPDRQVWVHLGRSGYAAGLLVAQTKPVAITASLLPADALQQALARDGKVDIQVNFATDSAQILPDSQPQLAQLVELLNKDSSLSLDVNGHTDASGNPAHNLRLSEQRAQAVVAALVAGGIDAARLHPAGLGDTVPAADNTSEEGRARNRRVELVRR